MNKINVLFFGSTSDSVIVAEKIYGLRIPNYELRIVSVVTQPPKPIGRKQIVTPTPVSDWSANHAIPVFSFPSNPQKPWLYDNEKTVTDTLVPFQANLIVSASYGQKIPDRTIAEARYEGINVHPSILPRWRGADPVPWALLAGDRQIGVTIVTISKDFDEGKILAHHKIPIGEKDTSDPTRTRLFSEGAALLETILPNYISGTLKGSNQDATRSSYARKFTRDDGFVPWEFLKCLQNGEIKPSAPIPRVLKNLDIENYQVAVVRMLRALDPWPGVWTTIPVNGEEKRMKILEASVDNTKLILQSVQLEGKKPVLWNQFLVAYLLHTT